MPTFDHQTLDLLREALLHLDAGFDDLPPFAPAVDHAAVRAVLLSVADRLRDNYPYQHPLYVGQMLKPPHSVARLAYALAQFINPNNHALDGGRASSAMEREAVAEIAAMIGWGDHLGHLTGGGTLANLEALWVAGRLRPGALIVASQQAHYTHARISDVLGLPFEAVATDARGRIDPAALEALCRERTVGTVVATLGTTSLGAVDRLPELLALRERYGFRLHIDAAYGGYFLLADDLDDETMTAYRMSFAADSFAIDPHKHGLQPYGCGCILFRDPAVGALYKHDSPYTYFTSADLHLGEISLECSRAGASAVALWATQRLFPLVRDGAFAAMLTDARRAALALHARLADDARFYVLPDPQLDILVYAPVAGSASTISSRSRVFFEAAARQENLHLALITLPRDLVAPHWADITWDQPTITCLRSVLMKPEHLAWIDPLWAALDRTMTAL